MAYYNYVINCNPSNNDSHFLLSHAVPIIPEFLYDIRHPDKPLSSLQKYPPSTTPAPPCGETTTPWDGLEMTTPGFDNTSFYQEQQELHDELIGETVEVGLMFASKAFVQLLVNPIVGPLTHK